MTQRSAAQIGAMNLSMSKQAHCSVVDESQSVGSEQQAHVRVLHYSFIVLLKLHVLAGHNLIHSRTRILNYV